MSTNAFSSLDACTVCGACRNKHAAAIFERGEWLCGYVRAGGTAIQLRSNGCSASAMHSCTIMKTLLSIRKATASRTVAWNEASLAARTSAHRKITTPTQHNPPANTERHPSKANQNYSSNDTTHIRDNCCRAARANRNCEHQIAVTASALSACVPVSHSPAC